MTAFLLIRHGAHDLLGLVLAGRQVDIGLNGEGHRQAAALAERCRDNKVSRVLSSPRRRARETAAPIAAALGVPLAIAPEFDEHDSGAWAGRTFADLAADPHWHDWNSRRGRTRPPGGESMADLQARITGFLAALAHGHPSERLILVSHAEPIRAALLHDRGLPLDDFAGVDVPVASTHTIDWPALHAERTQAQFKHAGTA